jgi:hypothetical protein
VPEPPGDIDLARHRDLEGRRLAEWLKLAFIALLVAVVVVALLNVFGQRQAKSTARAPAATMTVSAPSRVRGGLLYQARIHVHAHRPIQKPNLILDEGWFQQTTVNAIEPQPSAESSQNGRVELSFDPLKAGDTLVVWIYFQVNPTNVGRHHTDVELADGSDRLLKVDRTQFNFP